MIQKDISHIEQRTTMQNESKDHLPQSHFKRLGLSDLFRFFDTQFQGLLDSSHHPAARKID